MKILSNDNILLGKVAEVFLLSGGILGKDHHRESTNAILMLTVTNSAIPEHIHYLRSESTLQVFEPNIEDLSKLDTLGILCISTTEEQSNIITLTPS